MAGSVKGIGTDLIKIERAEKLYQRFGDRWVHRLLHQQELILFQQAPQPGVFLAKRFAAKEALAKALGTGIAKGVRFQDFIILKHASGQPQVTVTGQALQLAQQQNINRWHLSISDEKDYAIAFAVAT